MEFSSSLTQAILLKRYKRFLAEIILNNQEHRIIYCPNMGAMSGCDILGSKIWFSHLNNPRRKFPDTWELVEVNEGYLVCVNVQNTTPLVVEAIRNGVIPSLCGYAGLVVEPPTMGENSYDLVLENDPDEKCYIVTQTVTLGDEIHRGFYPDMATTRGLSQLKSLIQAKQEGHRAVLVYGVLHTGVQRIFPADHIDYEYGTLLRQASMQGVEIIGYRAEISLSQMNLATEVEVCIPARMICRSRSEKSK